MQTEEYKRRNLLGFEGDHYIGLEIEKLRDKFSLLYAFETGTYLGGTTLQLAKMFKWVYTVEIDETMFVEAAKNLSGVSNVQQLLGSSDEVLDKTLPTLPDKTLYFLDAHFFDYWPLLDELKTIAKHKIKPVIVIHDFKVPGRPDLGFDLYKGQPLDFNYIKASLLEIYGEEFKYHYNEQAEGAQRGVIYIYPA